jgi:FKBP-type peptidyl-prolyl cis-trans isomerase 2
MANQTIQKTDFIDITFTGRIKDGEIFDTNVKEDAEKIGINFNGKPLVICVGQGMVVGGFDNALEGKEAGKDYILELQPKDAFQERQSNLVKLIPIKIFRDKKINPYPGMTLNIDNMLVKVVSVSGGRVLVDFNNPLAGKVIIYNFKINKKIESPEEKVNALTEFFVGKTFSFKISDDKKQAIFKDEGSEEIPKGYLNIIIGSLNDKFKEVLGLEMIVEPDKEENKKQEKQEENKKAE